MQNMKAKQKLKKTFIIAAIIFFILIVYNFCTLWGEGGCSPNNPEGESLRMEKIDRTIHGKDYQSPILVNFAKPSMEDRLYIYEHNNCIYTGAVLHGNGGKSTAKVPEFSNKIGSKCSSLGVYKLAEISRTQLGIPCIRLDGLSSTNSNARVRGIVIHPSIMVTLTPFGINGVSYPLSPESEGCFAVSWHTFNKIKRLKRPAYLYAYYE